MEVTCTAVLLLLLTAGGVHLEPQQPAPVSTPAQKPPTRQTTGKVTPPAAVVPAATPPLDLDLLEQRLRTTRRIGVFTKITLKNQMDDLLDLFRDYYRGKAKVTMKDLRRRFDLLMMKVLSLLQDEDQELASAIVASREAIWALLADPKAFATLKG